MIWLLAGCIAVAYGEKSVSLDSAVSNMTKQLVVFPHEKIYLHTDKPYYITGEKIFFRAFLLDAFSNKPTQPSRYVYVELINPADSVVKRVKIRPDKDNLFHGAIPLDEALPQGTYKIRAYTQYMRNQGESSFYSKQVSISDPQILSMQTETDFQFDENGKINASLRFIDTKTQKVILPKSVIMRLNQERRFTGKPDKEGWIRVKLNAMDKATTRALYVEMTDNKRVFKQYLPIPYPEGDFDVSFYPEGGHLIAGQMSNVAFKAVNSNGTASNITGEITDSKGNSITKFKTYHDGMGEFTFVPQPDEHYQAVCRNGDRTLQFDLPKVQLNAFSLKTVRRNNKLWVTVNKNPSVSLPELYLLIHHGGLVIYANDWDTAKENATFDASFFPSGISHILLLTKDLQVVSERLVFLLNNDHGVAEFQTQKATYGKRELIRAGIQLKDGDELPLKGNFSIAVTNDREVIADTVYSLLSGILLRSELRGDIENPEFYFQKGNKEAEFSADLLMKTHGWTRYAIPDVVRGKLSYPQIPFEESQKFSGNVKSGLFSKIAKKFKVTLLSLDSRFYDLAETDENGRYLFQDFEFPESTKFVIQALNPKGKGKDMTELHVDEETFPGIETVTIEPAIQKEESNPVLLDYVAKTELYYTYENGMRITNLPEIVVTGVQKEDDKKKYKSIYYYEPDYSFSEKEIERQGGADIKNLLYRIPGVVVRGNSIRIRNAGGPPLIVLDDMPLPMPPRIARRDRNGFVGESPDQMIANYLNMINTNDIKQLDVIKGIETAAFGPQGSNGVIVIRTKRGEGWATSRSVSYNIKLLTPLGYQPPIEFYSPKYDSQTSIDYSKPDLRTTIFWKPNVITDDEGNATLDFYTADETGTYTVIIEGISADGKLIHYRGDASIKMK